MKKVLMVILALGLIGCLAVPAMADTAATINIYATVAPVVYITIDNGTDNLYFNLSPDGTVSDTQQVQITVGGNSPNGATLVATSGAWGQVAPVPSITFATAMLVHYSNSPLETYFEPFPVGGIYYVKVALPGEAGTTEAYSVLSGDYTATIDLTVTAD